MSQEVLSAKEGLVDAGAYPWNPITFGNEDAVTSDTNYLELSQMSLVKDTSHEVSPHTGQNGHYQKVYRQ